MDIEYVISNIADHFAFEEDIDKARNNSLEFVTDYYKKYGMKEGSLNYITNAINYLWLFSINENKEQGDFYRCPVITLYWQFRQGV